MKFLLKLALTPLAILLLLGIPSFSMAQPENTRATELGTKIRQLDLLNQLLPVLMTKEQLKKIIPVIDRARNAQQKEFAMELLEMKKVEGKVDKALKEARESKKVPSREMMSELFRMAKNFQATRAIVVADQLQNVRDILKATLNEGQLKAAANALDPRAYDPSADVSKMSQDRKLDNWIKYILLDWASFELLLQMSRS